MRADAKALLSAAAILLALSPAEAGMLSPPPGGAPAFIVLAQETVEDDTPFIMRLFGFRRRPVEERLQPRVIEVPPAAPQQPVRRAPPPPPPEPEIVIEPKAPGAKRVFVVGDSLAEELAAGLTIAFADTPTLDVIAETNGASGLASDDPVDWPRRMRELAAGSAPPDAVVVMLGEHDRVAMASGAGEVVFGTPPWDAAYRAEVEAMIEALRRERIPLYWVGLVPTADEAALADIAFLDEIYRQETSEGGAVYIDVWNAFADGMGAFASHGPDIEGVDARLRDQDGVHFTAAGERKLAFFVEGELRSWLRTGVPLALPAEVAGGGPVLFLNDPGAAEGEELAGATPPPQPAAGSALYRLVVEGRPLPPSTGRIDDWQAVN
jgi:hypothetical protein